MILFFRPSFKELTESRSGKRKRHQSFTSFIHKKKKQEQTTCDETYSNLPLNCDESAQTPISYFGTNPNLPSNCVNATDTMAQSDGGLYSSEDEPKDFQKVSERTSHETEKEQNIIQGGSPSENCTESPDLLSDSENDEGRSSLASIKKYVTT